MKYLSILIIIVFLSSCAGNPQLSQKRDEFQRTIPTCQDKQSCELMWAAARRWVLSHSGYKLKHIEQDFIETYSSSNSSTRLSVRVIKEPILGGGYKIVVSTWCNNIFRCSPNSWDAAIDFNRVVSKSINLQ